MYDPRCYFHLYPLLKHDRFYYASNFGILSFSVVAQSLVN